MDLVISFGERARPLRPPQGLRWLGVEVDLTLIFSVLPSAHIVFETANIMSIDLLACCNGSLGLPVTDDGGRSPPSN
jgi:hypothetical protein